MSLAEVIRRTNRSFLQYISSASPYVNAESKHILDSLRSLAQAEQKHLDAIAASLQKEHQPLPTLGAFPIQFTSYNFLDVRNLLPKLIESESQELRAIESEAERSELVEELLRLKRNHLEQLNKLLSGTK